MIFNPAVMMIEPEATTATITITGSSGYAQAEINGTTYLSAATVDVDIGTQVYLTAGYSAALQAKNAKITLNGTTVASGSGSTSSNATKAMYTLEITGDTSIALSTSGVGSQQYGIIAITTS